MWVSVAWWNGAAVLHLFLIPCGGVRGNAGGATGYKKGTPAEDSGEAAGCTLRHMRLVAAGDDRAAAGRGCQNAPAVCGAVEPRRRVGVAARFAHGET